ncbi:hypothetical protein HPP92_013867 [Vanilla planifolia]|uniref:cinnamyl-alcohol dehydrogenase n=1 Tax=Vanilla planifolia TaxID=51239 RepID=A0A835R398_VANPL|nr:hypothetical protein HPP92_013867 [Vanilla planifolia]
MVMPTKAREALGWAARDSSGLLSPFTFCRRHEIAGEVVETGPNVRKFKAGDSAGIGCFVGSCGDCEFCFQNLECCCPKSVFTYSSIDRDGSTTYGGYSDHIVVRERVYSPMRHLGIDRPGLHLGVVGLGGLGHVAVRFAKAMGMKVTVISSSPWKKKEAIELFGADGFIDSKNDEQMKAMMGSMDGIIDTVPVAHPLATLLALLKAQGKLVVVGGSTEDLKVPSMPLLMGRKLVFGSIAGGMKETQEMLYFAAEHNVRAEVEIIPISYVNNAMERLAKGDVKYRFVIDVRHLSRN